MKTNVIDAKYMIRMDILRLANQIWDETKDMEQEMIDSMKNRLVELETARTMSYSDEIDIEPCEPWLEEDEIELFWLIKVVHEQRKEEQSKWAADHAVLIETLHNLHGIYRSMVEKMEVGVFAMIWGNTCRITEDASQPYNYKHFPALKDGITWLLSTLDWIKQDGGEITIEY